MSQHAVKLRARLIHPHIVCFHTDFLLSLSSESEYKKLIMDSLCYSACHNDWCKQIIQAWCKHSNSISWFHYSCIRCTVVFRWAKHRNNSIWPNERLESGGFHWLCCTTPQNMDQKTWIHSESDGKTGHRWHEVLESQKSKVSLKTIIKQDHWEHNKGWVGGTSNWDLKYVHIIE